MIRKITACGTPNIYGFLGKFLMLSHLRSLALPVYTRLRGGDPARALAGGLFGFTIAAVVALLLVGAPVSSICLRRATGGRCVT